MRSAFTVKNFFEKEILDEIKNSKNEKAQPVDDIPTKIIKDNGKIFQTCFEELLVYWPFTKQLRKS